MAVKDRNSQVGIRHKVSEHSAYQEAGEPAPSQRRIDDDRIQLAALRVVGAHHFDGTTGYGAQRSTSEQAEKMGFSGRHLLRGFVEIGSNPPDFRRDAMAPGKFPERVGRDPLDLDAFQVAGR